jgi:hypothetical protein
VKRSTSIAWPIPRSFAVASGKLARSTLSTTSTSRVATRSDRLACQCVYQSASGSRRARTAGAASTAN